MSFVTSILKRERKENVVLIDIGARAVAGACVRYVGEEAPVVIYATHLPIEIQEGEDHSRAMLRALDHLAQTLTKEGVPALIRATKTGAVAQVLVSIDAPWQDTAIHSEEISRDGDFTFTKKLVTDAVTKVSPLEEGQVYTDASVVGTILNGYEVREPYGKRAHHAIIIILTSRMDTQVLRTLRESLAPLAKGSGSVIAGTSLRYQAMRAAFPHESEILIVDATSSLPEVALVRKGFLVAVSETPENDTTAEVGTAKDFTRGFETLAKSYPLPRTIFLIARSNNMEEAQKALESVNFSSVWLSDNPPNIVPVATSHLAPLVRQLATVASDLPLLLMALYYQHRDPNGLG
jgi:hypothetical protein